MRRPVPTEVREARLIDVSQPHAPYEPIDPQMIVAIRNSLERSRTIQQCAANDGSTTVPVGPGNSEKQPPFNVLAISGGGAYGAFDVGVLAGWSESKTRPAFDVVTGISTGAFIATFAFLGPQYDAMVRDLYINARTEDVYEKRLWISIINSSSIASSRPLKKRLETAITSDVLKEVAKAHANGRRLYIGTTDLDTRRFVIWDMGAIASSGKPDALDLYRKIVLASGSVPGFFPPVLIDVEVDGHKYQELHVDGGTTTSVFVPMAMTKCDPRTASLRPGSCVYVIASGKLYADSDTVKPKFVDITLDAISSMLYAGSRSDVFRIFNTALFCGMDFQLISVPQDFQLDATSLDIDAKQSHHLYELGFEMGKTRKGWRLTPPGIDVSEQVLPRTGTQFVTEKEMPSKPLIPAIK